VNLLSNASNIGPLNVTLLKSECSGLTKQFFTSGATPVMRMLGTSSPTADRLLSQWLPNSWVEAVGKIDRQSAGRAVAGNSSTK
jgi:hypothetical protein